MNKGGVRGIVLAAVLTVLVAGGLSAADHYQVVNGPARFYFGHISFVEPGPEGEAPTILREGRAEPEEAIVNLPVGPGDTVRTSADRRVEIQFDTGTIVRLDFATELRVETILARSLSKLDELSVMTLDRGRVYVMYKQYDRKELFQVLTPNAAVRMKHNSVAMIAAASDGTTEAQVKYGQARVLYGPDAGSLRDETVKKGQRLIVLADHQSELAAAIEGTAFDLWNGEINARFKDLHEGLSALPKPLQKLPPAVFYFAQMYGSRYGEWVWDELYGYVWRPFLDQNLYPWGWQPYYAGQWVAYNGQMYWIPSEPWGWVPYHLGVWHWDKKLGWVWMPGSLFAPAWATWDFYFFYAGWRPWGLFDWMFGYSPYGWSGFAYADGWDYTPYGGAIGRLAPDRLIPSTVVRRAQLQKPPVSSYPLPAELRKVLARVTDAYRRGDARVRESVEGVSRHLVLVDRRDLGAPAIERKAVTWDRVPKVGPPADGSDGRSFRHRIDPQREAARIVAGLDGPALPPRKVPSPSGAGPARGVEGPVPVDLAAPDERTAPRGEAAAGRFRDWNPDLRVARELGVRIEYAGASNAVRCPELRLTSRDREVAGGRVPRLTSHGIAYGPAVSMGGDRSDWSGGGSGSSGSSGSSASGGSSGRSASSSGGGGSRGAGETRGGGESRGGEGGTIKK
jgi:hypothetical protein